MKKHLSVPPLPPLSLKALDEVRKIEDYAQASLHHCGDEWAYNTQKALRILRVCVVASLDRQIAYYSSLSGYCPQWLAELREKTIYATVSLIGRAGRDNWNYLREELEQTVKDHLAQKAIQAKASARPKEKLEQKQIDRKKLRDEYLAKFDVKILDICWAAGQHYREWKRWLKRELKDGSTPDLAFRRLLISGKRPEEYASTPLAVNFPRFPLFSPYISPYISPHVSPYWATLPPMDIPSLYALILQLVGERR